MDPLCHDEAVEVSGAVVLVTGAGHGIGRATAMALSARHARLALLDRDPAALESIAAACNGLPITVDVSDPTHADEAIAQTLARYRRLDAVVANAGIGYAGAFADMPVAEVIALLDVNLRAPMLIARAALPHLLAQRHGALVFMTSIAATVPVPTEAAYCASKTALESFADALREEVRASGIRVSTVRPGVVNTAFLAQRNEPYARRWPRPIAPEQVANAVVRVLESGAERRTEPPWLDLAGRTRRHLPPVYRAMSRWFG